LSTILFAVAFSARLQNYKLFVKPPRKNEKNSSSTKACLPSPYPSSTQAQTAPLSLGRTWVRLGYSEKREKQKILRRWCSALIVSEIMAEDFGHCGCGGERNKVEMKNTGT
jgi:hypothetical protein